MATVEKLMSMATNPLADIDVHAAGDMTTVESSTTKVTSPLADVDVHAAGDITTVESSTTKVTSPLADIDVQAADDMTTAESSTTKVTSPLAAVDAQEVGAMPTAESSTNMVTPPLVDIDARTVDAMPTVESSIDIPIMTIPLADVNVPYVEVYDEPLHPTVLNNKYVRVLLAGCPANQETMFHRHSQDGFYIFFEPTQAKNEVFGMEPVEVEVNAGAVFWGGHLKNPTIHKVSAGDRELNGIDIEFKPDRPKSTSPFLPLASTASRELCLENDIMRAYRVTVAPGEDVYTSTLAAEEACALGSPYLSVVMKDAKTLSGGMVKAGDMCWRDGGSEGDAEENFACEDGAELIIVQPK